MHPAHESGPEVDARGASAPSHLALKLLQRGLDEAVVISVFDLDVGAWAGLFLCFGRDAAALDAPQPDGGRINKANLSVHG